MWIMIRVPLPIKKNLCLSNEYSPSSSLPHPRNPKYRKNYQAIMGIKWKLEINVDLFPPPFPTLPSPHATFLTYDIYIEINKFV